LAERCRTRALSLRALRERVAEGRVRARVPQHFGMPHPHPALLATFSRREKDPLLSLVSVKEVTQSAHGVIEIIGPIFDLLRSYKGWLRH